MPNCAERQWPTDRCCRRRRRTGPARGRRHPQAISRNRRRARDPSGALRVSRSSAYRRGAAGHPSEDEEMFRAATAGLKKLLPPVWGGATRQASVRAGLEELSASAPGIVLIHDAARPFFDRGADRARHRGCKAKWRRGAGDCDRGHGEKDQSVLDVIETLDRNQLRMVQTPQAFAFDLIMAAHRRAAAAGREDFSDDAALAEWAGYRVSVFEGDAGNVKLTTNDDFARAEIRTRRSATCAPATVLTCTPSPTATMSCSAASAFPTRAASPGIPTPTWRSTPWSTPFSARWPRAISVSISAERPAMERRLLGPLPRFRLRTRARPRRHDCQSRRHRGVRSAARLAAS